jgi:hypothetical protein
MMKTKLIQTIRENIADGMNLLNRNALVGQGYVCALEDGSMAVRREGDQYHLWPVTGTLCGISHYTLRGAMTTAHAWNKTDTDLKVRVVYFQDLISESIARWCELVDELELDRDVETEEIP